MPSLQNPLQNHMLAALPVDDFNCLNLFGTGADAAGGSVI